MEEAASCGGAQTSGAVVHLQSGVYITAGDFLIHGRNVHVQRMTLVTEIEAKRGNGASLVVEIVSRGHHPGTQHFLGGYGAPAEIRRDNYGRTWRRYDRDGVD